ncbi:MAG: hypothetical protein U1E30_05060 [Rhodoblastus sp.]
MNSPIPRLRQRDAREHHGKQRPQDQRIDGDDGEGGRPAPSRQKFRRRAAQHLHSATAAKIAKAEGSSRISQSCATFPPCLPWISLHLSKIAQMRRQIVFAVERAYREKPASTFRCARWPLRVDFPA